VEDGFIANTSNRRWKDGEQEERDGGGGGGEQCSRRTWSNAHNIFFRVGRGLQICCAKGGGSGWRALPSQHQLYLRVRSINA